MYVYHPQIFTVPARIFIGTDCKFAVSSQISHKASVLVTLIILHYSAIMQPSGVRNDFQLRFDFFRKNCDVCITSSAEIIIDAFIKREQPRVAVRPGNAR